ncbi:hypothetical protein EHW67_16110 [Arenibacter aquaticus]|uniref:Uncharacterized protein n=1 Tax=Arenibacter aquaticus TaxID=2489054 RepID=A0A3S0IJN8_9FLAO|nr:hypothetical protein [Arenibacter aquaticus]RTE51734.1 hypothetical protein EHW67_16110 [Arenibacter aquaticus]
MKRNYCTQQTALMGQITYLGPSPRKKTKFTTDPLNKSKVALYKASDNYCTPICTSPDKPFSALGMIKTQYPKYKLLSIGYAG